MAKKERNELWHSLSVSLFFLAVYLNAKRRGIVCVHVFFVRTQDSMCRRRQSGLLISRRHHHEFWTLCSSSPLLAAKNLAPVSCCCNLAASLFFSYDHDSSYLLLSPFFLSSELDSNFVARSPHILSLSLSLNFLTSPPTCEHSLSFTHTHTKTTMATADPAVSSFSLCLSCPHSRH